MGASSTHPPLPAFTTDPLHHQAAPIRYTISDLTYVSCWRMLLLMGIASVWHTRACLSQLPACVSRCHLPLPAGCLALCIVKFMLLLVDGVRWMNDVVATRCVCARYIARAACHLCALASLVDATHHRAHIVNQSVVLLY